MSPPERPRRRRAGDVYPLIISLVALGVAVSAAGSAFLTRSHDKRAQELRLYSTRLERTSQIGVGLGRAAVVYSVAVPKLAPDDVLLVTTAAEVTNDLPYNVFVGAQLVVASSPTATRGSSLNAGSGTNVTPAIHHGVVVRSAAYRPSGVLGSRYINLVLVADSSRGPTPGGLRVERGGGELSVLRFSSLRGS